MIASWTKAVPESPNIDVLIKDLFNNSQVKQQPGRIVEYCPKLKTFPKLIHKQENDVQHDILQLEDCVQCKRRLEYSMLGKAHFICRHVKAGISAGVDAKVRDIATTSFRQLTVTVLSAWTRNVGSVTRIGKSEPSKKKKNGHARQARRGALEDEREKENKIQSLEHFQIYQ